MLGLADNGRDRPLKLPAGPQRLSRTTATSYKQTMIDAVRLWFEVKGEAAEIAVYTSIVTILVAAATILVQRQAAKQQIKVAERTQFLNLIERRARWFDTLMEAWNQRVREQEEGIEAIIQEKMPASGKAQASLAALRREALWLFEPDVAVQLDTLDGIGQDYIRARLKVRQADIVPTTVLTPNLAVEHEMMILALLAMQAELATVAQVLRPYLYVGDIRTSAASIDGVLTSPIPDQ